MPQSTADKIYLNVPFPAKDRARGLGARWDPVVRKWDVAGKIPRSPPSGSGYHSTSRRPHFGPDFPLPAVQV